MNAKDVRHWIDRSAPYLAGAACAAAAVVTYRYVSNHRNHAAGAGPMTPSTTDAQAADAPIGAPGRNEDDRLDEALQETFPTSDPVSVQIT